MRTVPVTYPTTFGYLDKYDLKDCAAYIKKESRLKLGFSYSDVDGRKVLKNCKTKDIPLLIINGKKDGITIDHKIFACYNAELRGFIAKKLDNKGFSAISI